MAQGIAALLAMTILAGRAAGIPSGGLPGAEAIGNEYKGFYSAYTYSGDGVSENDSLNLYYADAPFNLYGALRTQSASVIQKQFSDLGGWGATTNTTGNVDTFATGEPNPTEYAVRLKTGSQVGGLAQISRNIGSVPASFGLSYIINMKQVGYSILDAPQILLTNDLGHTLHIRMKNDQIAVFVGGKFVQIFASNLGNYATEMWFEVTNINRTNLYYIDLYLGTERVGRVSGSLPAYGYSNGDYYTYLQSGLERDREVWLYIMQVGASALSSKMVVTSTKYQQNTPSSKAYITILIEDDSNNLVVGENMYMHVTCNGYNYLPVQVTYNGIVGGGVLDPPKYTRAIGGEVQLGNCVMGQTLGYKIQTNAGVYAPILGAAIVLE